MLNCWFLEERFLDIVKHWWESYEVHGWMAYVLTERLKRLKNELRRWNKESFGGVQKQAKELVETTNGMDLKEEEEGLNDEEVETRRVLLGDFWRMSRRHESLLQQKIEI